MIFLSSADICVGAARGWHYRETIAHFICLLTLQQWYQVTIHRGENMCVCLCVCVQEHCCFFLFLLLFLFFVHPHPFLHSNISQSPTFQKEREACPVCVCVRERNTHRLSCVCVCVFEHLQCCLISVTWWEGGPGHYWLYQPKAERRPRATRTASAFGLLVCLFVLSSLNPRVSSFSAQNVKLFQALWPKEKEEVLEEEEAGEERVSWSSVCVSASEKPA